MPLVIFGAVVVGIGIGIFGLNYYHATRCAEAHSPEEIKSFLDVVTKRILTAESQTIHNSLFLEKMLNTLERKLIASEDHEFSALATKSQDEAVRVAMQLAAQPYTTRAEFRLADKYLDAEVLADAINDVLKSADEAGDEDDKKDDFLMVSGAGEGGGGGGGGGGSEGNFFSAEKDSAPSDVEILTMCSDWKTKYSVVQGVSWGHLPFDLQGRWMKLKCDIYLQNSIPL